MTDTFTEVTHQGYGSRVANSFKGLVVGLLLFLGSFVLLWWNEGNLAREREAFTEMEKLVVPAPPDSMNESLNGNLVYLATDLFASQEIGDPQFLHPGSYLVLERNVEMYQWVEHEESETREKIGGGSETRTTYRYTKEWKSGRENSSSFKQSAGHTNPPLRYDNQTFRALGTKFGVYEGDDIVERLSGEESLALTSAMAANRDVTLSDNYLYLPLSPGKTAPEIGDIRISYRVTRPGIFSIIAVQSDGGRFTVFTASNGKEKFLVESGNKSSKQIIAAARDAAGLIAWILRGVGAFLMWIGMMMFLNPIATVLSILPPLASIGRGAIGLFSLILALILSGLTIIVAMIAHNPLLLAGVIALGLAGAVMWLKSKAKHLPPLPQPVLATPPPPPAR